MAAVPSIGRATALEPRPSAREAELTHDLYERYGRQIFGFCLHQLGNREEAEDATQTTFLNAFRGLQRGVVPELESAWLYKIANNVILTRRRSSSRRRRVETPGDLDAIQDMLPSRERDADELIRLSEALGAMPEQQRKALLLREWQGLSYHEIAAELDLSQSAVETLLFRARRTLAQGLTEAPKEKKGRLRSGLDAGSVMALLKGLLSGGAAVKTVATVAAVASTAVVAGAPVPIHEKLLRSESDKPAAAKPKTALPASGGFAARTSSAPIKPTGVPGPKEHRLAASQFAAAHAMLLSPAFQLSSGRQLEPIETAAPIPSSTIEAPAVADGSTSGSVPQSTSVDVVPTIASAPQPSPGAPAASQPAAPSTTPSGKQPDAKTPKPETPKAGDPKTRWTATPVPKTTQPETRQPDVKQPVAKQPDPKSSGTSSVPKSKQPDDSSQPSWKQPEPKQPAWRQPATSSKTTTKQANLVPVAATKPVQVAGTPSSSSIGKQTGSTSWDWPSAKGQGDGKNDDRSRSWAASPQAPAPAAGTTTAPTPSVAPPPTTTAPTSTTAAPIATAPATTTPAPTPQPQSTVSAPAPSTPSWRSDDRSRYDGGRHH